MVSGQKTQGLYSLMWDTSLNKQAAPGWEYSQINIEKIYQPGMKHGDGKVLHIA